MCGLCGWRIFPLVALSACSNSHSHSNDSESVNDFGKAIEILKERYAKGEISKEIFLEMRSDIES